MNKIMFHTHTQYNAIYVPLWCCA